MRRAAGERLAAAADPAAGRLVKLVRSSDEMVALRAACAVLDRTGHGKRSAVDVSTAVRVEAERLVDFTRGLLEDLGIPLTPAVREIAAARLRTMAAAQADHAPHLRAVPR